MPRRNTIITSSAIKLNRPAGIGKQCYSGLFRQGVIEMNSVVSNSSMWNTVRVGSAAVYLLCAAVSGFRSPGMYYDEAIFLNGGVQVISSGQEPSFAHDPSSWVTIFGRRWPIMVMPYVGAIRDYLVLLPFAIFGPTYYAARIPTALVGAFGIWGLSILMRDQIGAKAAALGSLALSIHPAYLAWTLDELADGHVVNQVVVDADTAHDAKVALERMLSVR